MDLKDTYARGQCASLAMAVLQHFELPCVVFYNTDPDDDSAAHVANAFGEHFLDIYGIVTHADLEGRYGCELRAVLDPKGEDTAVQFEVCMGEWTDTEDDPYGAWRAWNDCSAVMMAHLGRTDRESRMEKNQEVRVAIDALAEAQEEDFSVVFQPGGWRADPSRPILLVVHPGDAIERACDWPDPQIGTQVENLSRANQTGMAVEITAKLATHDVVVLHRLSSAYLSRPGVEPSYKDALAQCDAVGLVLYGDDLPAASDWMLRNVAALNEPGTQVFMTGAYADAAYGCITALGKALLATNPGLRIEISGHSPTDSSNSVPRWVPPSASSVSLGERPPAPAPGHLPSDLKDVAQWMGLPAESIEFEVGNESIDPFLKQIHEMESTYLEFPKDAARTDAIERRLRAGEPPLPVYVEHGDEHNFVMEGRHRMVAFHRVGLVDIPVCRVRPVQTDVARPRPQY